MNKKTIELFLQRNPIDDDFFIWLINESFYIEKRQSSDFVLEIDLDLIKTIGISSSHVFIETDFGRYSFFKKIKQNIIKGDE